LTVSGMRQIGFGSETSMIPFLERISIDSWISMDRFSAKLSNGLLLVTAPKEFDAKDSFVQKISIQDVDTKEQATD
jgi:HSP20 family molecular chaperone IbpA